MTAGYPHNVTATQAPAPTADQILRQNGLNGDRLLRIARRIANDAQRKAPAGLGGRYEDLVSFLLVQANAATLRFDPNRLGPNYTFASWIWDIMEKRVPDFYRRKSEGFGDSRSGSNGRIVLAGDTLDQQPDHQDPYDQQPEPADHDAERSYQHWAHAAGIISTPMHDWDHVTEQHAMRWTRAAQTLNLTLDVWIRRTLDIAAQHQLGDKQAA